jgi:hypothetical protein
MRAARVAAGPALFSCLRTLGAGSPNNPAAVF